MEYKYISKKEKWVSNGNGGQELVRRYRYDTTDNIVLGLMLIFALVASPLLLVSKIRRKMKYSTNKPLIERLKEKQEENLEKLYQARQRLWNIIKDKRNGEDDIHFAKRLKRYGFTTDGTHIKTGVNYQTNKEKETGTMEKNSIWNDILKSFASNPRDVVTLKKGLWFYVYEENGHLCVESGRDHTKCSEITLQRKLCYKDFEKTYCMYVSGAPKTEIMRATHNSSYWYGIFSDVLNEQ